MKKLLILTVLTVLLHTGRYYPIFTGNVGITMLMCEYRGGSMPLDSSVWLQFENTCPSSVNY